MPKQEINLTGDPLQDINTMFPLLDDIDKENALKFIMILHDGTARIQQLEDENNQLRSKITKGEV